MDKWSKHFKILDVPWHIGHQYEQAKFPFVSWSWLRQYKRQYNPTVRTDFAKDYNIEWVNDYEPGKYDVVLLHLDQQCFETGIWDRGKGRVYQDLNAIIKDVPKIVLMHGTPYYPEVEELADPDILRERLRLVLGDSTLVVNSHTAAKQWGNNARAIIHGMEPSEWWDLPKEVRVVTMIGPGGLDQYYDRTFLAGVKEELQDRGIEHCHITVDWQAKNWDDYRDFLGRSLVYFNPTRESPMPRSRTEAMLSGCCVITTPHQDASNFIKDGENGYLCRRDPIQVADLVQQCFNNYKQALEIGQKGKQTALELFGWERYANDWYNLLCEVTNK